MIIRYLALSLKSSCRRSAQNHVANVPWPGILHMDEGLGSFKRMIRVLGDFRCNFFIGLQALLQDASMDMYRQLYLPQTNMEQNRVFEIP